MEKGPLDGAMAYSGELHRWGWDHNSPDDYFPYSATDYTRIDHEIVIVGWKDDPNIEKGGYWICKNNMGREWGYDGFFNI